MTGENGDWLNPRSVQPGGRPPAPGSLALVQAFINSHYDLEFDHGADLFDSPTRLRAWLASRRLIDARAQVTDDDLLRAVAVREGLRELARCSDNGDVAPALSLLNEAAEGTAVEMRFGDRGPRFVARAGGGVNSAVGLILGLTTQAMLEGSWTRLKICPGDDCGWAFFDHSRNQTGRWCSMSVCGGRAKARSHYQRRRGAS